MKMIGMLWPPAINRSCKPMLLNPGICTSEMTHDVWWICSALRKSTADANVEVL